jgi:predicted ATPase/tRNA A-37 threonylcarbamoyl transferase component Bud32
MATQCPNCYSGNPSDSKFCKECGTQLPVSMDFPSHTKTLEIPTEEFKKGNTIAGRYEIIEELGQGGMGRVYRVQDTKINEEVALKLIKYEIAADKKTIERFKGELKIARKIRHKNVCGMYDLGEEKGLHFITMEYVSGENLKSLIRKEKRFGTEMIISIAKQVCEGLSEAHRLGVVHRDLKPSNIMIDREGNARIMDFGIARSLKTKGITDAGVIIGTPDYMSPEQVVGKDVDQRSDIYSLGVILYEMITGQVPFVGDTPLSVAYQHKHEPPQDPRTFNDQIDEILSHLVLKCLKKDKENRFQSAEEVLLALTGDTSFVSFPGDVVSSLKSPDAYPNNLPIQPTSFIGREKDLVSTRKLLSQAEVHLLTLTGPGGIGKTRLGLQLAAELSDEFQDGIFFVPLAPITDPMLVTPTIAQTLDVHEKGNQSILTTLGEFLKHKKMLLFLDNFEHVGEAASDIAQLLETCSFIKFLITSREVLHVKGEHEFLVRPLAFPDLSHRTTMDLLTRNPSVELFSQRAQSVKPGFSVSDENAQSVAEICARLDGLPLAIELAAARVKLFPPKALLRRLIEADGQSSLRILTHGPRDAPARHRTLRSAMDWSYELLDENEQKLFQTLSVFAGGFTFLAAEAVCCPLDSNPDSQSEETLGMDVMDGLASLLDKSLLRQDESEEEELRFSMLGMIREYAGEKLRESGREVSIRERHADFFLTLAEEAKSQLKGPEQEVWLERLEEEHNNLRSALGWFLQKAEENSEDSAKSAVLGLRMAGALSQFWDTHGYVSEGRRWLQKVLTFAETPTHERVDALTGAGWLAARHSDMGEAIPLYDQAINIAREIGYKTGIAKALGGMAFAKEFLATDDALIEALHSESLELWREAGDKRGIATALGPLAKRAASAYDFEQANKLFEESLALFREVQDKREIAGALWNLAQIAVVVGQYDKAREMYSESHKIYEDLKDLHGVATQLRGLGRVERFQGNTERARALYEEALESFRTMGDKGCGSIALAGLGRVVLDQDDIEGATSLAQECLSMSREVGFKAVEAQALRLLGLCEFAQGNNKSAKKHFIESIQLEEELDHREGIAENLEGIASLATAQSEYDRAAQLFSAAEVLRATLGIPLPPADASSLDKWKAILRDGLDEAAYQSAKEEGKVLTIEQAIELAK